MICSFVIPGDVVPWARAGARGKVHFTPKKQRAFMAVLRDKGREAMGDAVPIDQPVELKLVAVYTPPKTRTRAAKAQPNAGFKATKPDGSNIQKIVEDALNGIVWSDDARVAAWHGAKIYGERPELRVSVHPLSFLSWPFLGGVTA